MERIQLGHSRPGACCCSLNTVQDCARPLLPSLMLAQVSCPVCDGTCCLLDTVDLSKSCTEAAGTPLPPAGIPVAYFLCEQCGFCFAPELSHWRVEDFEAKIYNSDYVRVDPDYVEARPRANAQSLIGTFADKAADIRHLDYGGGSGLLSRTLREHGWRSTSYDPFVDRDIRLSELGKFELITAYEVFEHVPDVTRLISDLSVLLNHDGIVLFSTLLSDGNLGPHQRLTWWYAAPRNGHISLFSGKSLAMLGAREGFKLGSFTTNLHAFWRAVPRWAAHIIRAS